MSHDQNFKNLILDYPREALAFFAATEARAIDAGARVVPLREEQLKERLGERFRELDVPLLVEWPDGRRTALLFVVEEETDPQRFDLHRLAHYCLDLAALYDTERVVPVVIFLHRGNYRRQLTLGSETRAYLRFETLVCALFETLAREHLHSDNLVARLALPTMAYRPEEKLAVYAAATRGLLALEPDPERRLKYADFIDIYAALDETELARYRQHYPQEAEAMSGFAASVSPSKALSTVSGRAKRPSCCVYWCGSSVPLRPMPTARASSRPSPSSSSAGPSASSAPSGPRTSSLDPSPERASPIVAP